MEEWKHSASSLAVSRRFLTAKVVVNRRRSKFELMVGQVALAYRIILFVNNTVFPPLTPFPLYPYSHNYHRRYCMLAIYSSSE